MIHSVDEPGRRSVLQVVGKRVDLSLQNEWGGRMPRTQIVAIGAHGVVDGEALRQTFERCVVAAR